MRVAMVSPYDLSIPGGVQGQVDGLAKALERAGSSVTVVAPVGFEGVLGETGYVLAPTGRSIRVPANGSQAPVAPGPITMVRTLRILRRLEPDVVHVHEPLVPGSSLAAVAAGPRPIVATFHRAGTDALYRAEGALLRPLRRRLGALVAVSEAARATATEVLGGLSGPIELIPNGIDLQRYAEAAAGASGRPHRGTVDDPLRLLFVGRHEERKGLGVLLAAARRLQAMASSDVPSWRLLVVGDGPETAELKRGTAVDESTEWLGVVDDAERTRLLAGADVFVAPSVGGESFGVVLLEAMAAGAAVVASDLPGYRMAAGNAARLFPAGDVGALASTLASVLADPQERRHLGERSLARADRFSMDAVAARYLELYDRLASART